LIFKSLFFPEQGLRPRWSRAMGKPGRGARRAETGRAEGQLKLNHKQIKLVLLLNLAPIITCIIQNICYM
jgi:hypothetical protein